MFHALMLAPRRDRLIKRVVAGDRAEQSDVTLAEGADDFGRQRHLAHRQELHRLEPRRRPLRIGIEGPDRFQRVAEEIEPDRIAARRIEIEDAAAHGILARIGDGAGAHIAGNLQTLDQRLHRQHVARLKLEARGGNELARRDLLQQRIDGSQHDERLAIVGRACRERGKRGDAPRDGLAVGRHAVVGHAVPGGEDQYLHVRREEAERLFQRGEPVGVARDMQDRLDAPLACMTRNLPKQKRIEPFGHAAGDRALGLEQTIDRQGWKFCR